jgi:hypothetical protein
VFAQGLQGFVLRNVHAVPCAGAKQG